MNFDNEEVMVSLKKVVFVSGVDLGVIFDMDVDCVVIMDKNGESLNCNLLIVVIFSIILEEKLGIIIVIDFIIFGYL